MYKIIIIMLLGYHIYGLNKLAGYPIKSLVKVENALKELPSAVLVEYVSIIEKVVDLFSFKMRNSGDNIYKVGSKSNLFCMSWNTSNFVR